MSSSKKEPEVVFRNDEIEEVSITDTEPQQDPGLTDNRTLFVANVHYQVQDNELEAVFSRFGRVSSIFMVRHQETGLRKGYGFVIFEEETAAREACQALNSYPLKDRKLVYVAMADTNRRLYLGNIPKCKTAKHLRFDLENHLNGLTKVIVYKSMEGDSNRGFCFLEFNNHQQASTAMARLCEKLANIWGCPFVVDWADPLQEPGDDVMSQVKIVYISNIGQKVTEDYIWQKSQAFGEVERVKKIKHYAFVHFKERNCALEAIKKLNGEVWEGESIKVVLSKPPIDKKQREELLRSRHMRKIKANLRIKDPMPHNVGQLEGSNDDNIPRIPMQEPENQMDYSYGAQCRGIEIQEPVIQIDNSYGVRCRGTKACHYCTPLLNDQHCSCLKSSHDHEIQTRGPMCNPVGHCIEDEKYSFEALCAPMEAPCPCKRTTYNVPFTPLEVPHRHEKELFSMREHHHQLPRENTCSFIGMSESERFAAGGIEAARLTKVQGFSHGGDSELNKTVWEPNAEDFVLNEINENINVCSYLTNRNDELSCLLNQGFVKISERPTKPGGDTFYSNEALISQNSFRQTANQKNEDIQRRPEPFPVKHCMCCEFGARRKIM